MNASLPRALLLVSLATLIAFGSAGTAHAGSPAPAGLHKVSVPGVGLLKTKKPKVDLLKYAPKVKFKAKGKLSKTTARVNLYANVSFAGKTKKISIFNMGIRKKGKSVKVKRKIGKLKVSLTVSWSGERTLVIKGTARYLKFKVPVPRIKVRV